MTSEVIEELMEMKNQNRQRWMDEDNLNSGLQEGDFFSPIDLMIEESHLCLREKRRLQ